MVEETAKEDRVNWQTMVYAAAGALAVFLPLILWSLDFGWLLYSFVATPIVSVVLIALAVRSQRRRRLSWLSALLVFWAFSWVLLQNPFTVRSTTRWLLWSRSFKEEVLAQPQPAIGELKHADWDGWGWAGADTEVYLVFDPKDSLAAEVKSHSAGKFTGIPCEVPKVRRLESRWYSVTLFTDSTWGQCH